MINRAEESMIMDETKKMQLFELYFSFVKKWHQQAFPERWFNESWHRELAKYHFNKYYNFKNTIKLNYEPIAV